MQAMEAALVKELSLRIATESPNFNDLQSIYFGGGTPSLFPETGLERLLNLVLPEAVNCREVTLEANPEDITPEKLAAWRKLGVTRLSIGLQTFDQNRLDWMNRKHSAEQAEQAVRWAAAAGFAHISADLIYGLPGRSHAFEEEVQRFTSLPVDHLSAYILTVEDQTVLGRRVANGQEKIADETAVEGEYEMLCRELARAGFEHYEVSNWARPGGHAVHNQHYWSGLPYWGIGPGAHGFDGAQRTANVSNNPRYIKSLGEAQSVADLPAQSERLTETDRYNETIMTGLRTARGIDLKALESQFGLRPDRVASAAWRRYVEAGVIVSSEPENHRIPEAHWLIADAVASDLFKA